MNLFQLGEYTLASGAKSNFKLECDALTDEDWKAIAWMLSVQVGPFSTVEGVPTGGLKLAAALEKYKDPNMEGPHLIVDDVLTTGGSMEKCLGAFKTCLMEKNPPPPVVKKYIIGAVVFARGQCPWWITPLFQLSNKFWLPRS